MAPPPRRLLAEVTRLTAMFFLMPAVMCYLATGAAIAWLLAPAAPRLGAPPTPPTATATTTTTATAAPAAPAAAATPPSASRRMKRPRKYALHFDATAEEEQNDDTVPDRRCRAAAGPSLTAATQPPPPSAPPPPRPPPLALSARELRLLQTRAPAEFLCALDACAMLDPVITPSGLSFERSCAERWLARWGVDPATSAPLTASQLYANLAVRDRIVAWLEEEEEERRREMDAEEEVEEEEVEEEEVVVGGMGRGKMAATDLGARDVDAEID